MSSFIWSSVNEPVNLLSIAISKDGKYQLASNVGVEGEIRVSDSYGMRWNNLVFSHGTGTSFWTKIVLDKIGKTISSNQIEQYWLALSPAGYTIKGINSIIDGEIAVIFEGIVLTSGSKDIAISDDGSCMTILTDTDLQLSTDYGQTWTTKALPTGLAAYERVAMSGNGEIITIAGIDLSSSDIQVSIDQGDTWTPSTLNVPIGFSPGWNDIALSFDGQYQTLSSRNNDNNLISSDYGATFNETGTPGFYNGTSISSSGQYQVLTNIYTTPKVQYSNDYGQTWQPIDDFDSFSTYNYWSASMSSNGDKIAIAMDNYGLFEWTLRYPTYFINSNGSNEYPFDTPVKGAKNFRNLFDSLLLSKIWSRENSWTQQSLTNCNAVALSNSIIYEDVANSGIQYAVGDNINAVGPVINSSDWFRHYAKSKSAEYPYPTLGGYGQGIIQDSLTGSFNLIACNYYGDWVIAIGPDGLYHSGYKVIFEQYAQGNIFTKEVDGDFIAVSASSNKDQIYSQIAAKDIGRLYINPSPNPELYRECGPDDSWQSVAISMFRAIAVTKAGVAYESIDLGDTWNALPNWPGAQYIALSQDFPDQGTYQLAASSSGNLYVSSDIGVTWTTIPINKSWKSLAVSNDGKIQLAASDDVYLSEDYGVTWNAQNLTGSWKNVAISPDGLVRTAVNDNGEVYSWGISKIVPELTIDIVNDGIITEPAYPTNLLTNSEGITIQSWSGNTDKPQISCPSYSSGIIFNVISNNLDVSEINFEPSVPGTTQAIFYFSYGRGFDSIISECDFNYAHKAITFNKDYPFFSVISNNNFNRGVYPIVLFCTHNNVLQSNKFFKTSQNSISHGFLGQGFIYNTFFNKNKFFKGPGLSIVDMLFNMHSDNVIIRKNIFFRTSSMDSFYLNIWFSSVSNCNSELDNNLLTGASIQYSICYKALIANNFFLYQQSLPLYLNTSTEDANIVNNLFVGTKRFGTPAMDGYGVVYANNYISGLLDYNLDYDCCNTVHYKIISGSVTPGPNNITTDPQLKLPYNRLYSGTYLPLLANTNININDLTNPSFIVDGIVVGNFGAVLLINQTNPIDNGIYWYSYGTVSRPPAGTPDLPLGQHANGIYVYISRGTAYIDTGWLCTTTYGTDIVGTDPIYFTQYSDDAMLGMLPYVEDSSPCIDAGVGGDIVPGVPTEDIRDLIRPIRYNTPVDDGTDIGPIETVLPPVLSYPLDGDVEVSVLPRLEWLAADTMDFYNLQLRNSNGDILYDITGLTGLYFDIPDYLNFEAVYSWRVQSAKVYNSQQFLSNWSNENEFTTTAGVETESKLYFEQYDFNTGGVVGRITEFNYDDLIQKQHYIKPIVFRAFAETGVTVSNLKIYMENKGTIPGTRFAYYTDSTFIPSIQSGSSLMTYFSEIPDASVTSPNAVFLGWDASSRYSHYMWLDIQIEKQWLSSVGSTSDATFKMFFNYT